MHTWAQCFHFFKANKRPIVRAINPLNRQRNVGRWAQNTTDAHGSLNVLLQLLSGTSKLENYWYLHDLCKLLPFLDAQEVNPQRLEKFFRKVVCIHILYASEVFLIYSYIQQYDTVHSQSQMN